MKKPSCIQSISRNHGPLGVLDPEDLMRLPFPYDQGGSRSLAIAAQDESVLGPFESGLDGASFLRMAKPKTEREEHELVERFLSGLRKLLSPDDNWTFWQPLTQTLDCCVKCQTCSEACPVYLSSGRQEMYKPCFRSEVLRRIKARYIDQGGSSLAWLRGNSIELNWTVVARLAESAYRCTLCRRCAQCCPMGCDNGLVTHELRKLFSQEMGIAPAELHEAGTVMQLSAGSGSSSGSFGATVRLMEREIRARTGRDITIPVDRVGADALLVFTSAESLEWLSNPEAFAIILAYGGVDYTLSSELGFNGTNFGLWYDDVQFARVAMRQMAIAKKLKVNRILVGECGHASKALVVIADRILTDDVNIPRESYLPLFEQLVCGGRLELDPKRNDFPVTLHDPCNIVRLMGIVQPQRNILKQICPQFREMEPHGLDNYCCGGGGGLGILSSAHARDWTAAVSGRMKLKQIVDAFQEVPGPEIHKYLCAPCTNCKVQMRNLFEHYDVWQKSGILYGGLAELIVNAMPLPQPFIEWQWR